MTDFSNRMLQDLQLSGYSKCTQELYLRAVRQLAEHFNQPLDQITEEQLRDYFLYPEKSGSRNGRAPQAPSRFAASSSSTKKP